MEKVVYLILRYTTFLLLVSWINLVYIIRILLVCDFYSQCGSVGEKVVVRPVEDNKTSIVGTGDEDILTSPWHKGERKWHLMEYLSLLL